MSPVSASMAPSWRVSRSESACYYISNMSDRLAIQPLVDALLADNREVLDRHMTERGASLVDLVWQPDATLCPEPQLNHALAYWHEIRGDRPMPMASANYHFHLRPALGHAIGRASCRDRVCQDG